MLCYLFSFYLHAWSSPTQRIAPHHLLYCIFENLPWLYAAGICRRNLPWLIAARICRGNLLQVFAVAIFRENLPWIFCIYKQILFCICEQILFIWRQTFFICVQNFLICEIFFINSASSCYCRDSYGPPYYWKELLKAWSKQHRHNLSQVLWKLFKC